MRENGVAVEKDGGVVGVISEQEERHVTPK